MLILGIVLLPFFILSLYIFLKFSWGEEGKDERGQKILNRSLMLSGPIIPIGWLLMEMYLEFYDVSFTLYRDTIWILILLSFIMQGTTIFIYKKRI